MGLLARAEITMAKTPVGRCACRDLRGAVDSTELGLARKPVRAISKFLVPQPVLSPRHGTYICRTARKVPRYQAQLGHSAATHSTRRTCWWNFRSRIPACSVHA